MWKWATFGGIAVALAVLVFAAMMTFGSGKTNDNGDSRIGNQAAHANPSPGDAVAGVPPEGASAAPPAITPTRSPTDARARVIQSYLANQFGAPGPSRPEWYEKIDNVTVEGTTAILATTLADGQKSLASQVCAAVAKYVDDPQNAQVQVDTIRVVGVSGQPLVERNGPGGSCG